MPLFGRECFAMRCGARTQRADVVPLRRETERQKAIERENGILLGKLSRIAARKGPEGSGLDRAHRALHPGEACSLGSLNGLSRKRELQRIARDNHAILKRIQERQSQKSCYDRQMMDQEWQQTLMYRKLASQLQESPTKGDVTKRSEIDVAE